MVIITKYTTYSHFIVNSSGDIYEAPYINSNLDDAERYNGNALLSISIVCGIGVFALTAGVILTTCKKKKED